MNSYSKAQGVLGLDPTRSGSFEQPSQRLERGAWVLMIYSFLAAHIGNLRKYFDERNPCIRRYYA